MSKAILFVCQACRFDHTDASSEQPSEGAKLLTHLQALHPTWLLLSALEIQPVECLWTCDHPCVIALSSPQKSTYMLASVPVVDAVEQTAAAVLELSQLYLNSKDGTIPWKQFPEVLQTDIIARIPPLSPTPTNEN